MYTQGVFKKYRAVRSFYIGGMGTTVGLNHEVEFDGVTVRYAGRTHEAQNLRAAIERQGWLVPVEKAAQKVVAPEPVEEVQPVRSKLPVERETVKTIRKAPKEEKTKEDAPKPKSERVITIKTFEPKTEVEEEASETNVSLGNEKVIDLGKNWNKRRAKAERVAEAVKYKNQPEALEAIRNAETDEVRDMIDAELDSSMDWFE